MLTTKKFSIILFCFSLVHPYATPVEQQNLWHQIIPLIGNADITKAQTQEEILKACTAQAVIQDGIPHQILDDEMLQTMKSLHLFSHVLPKINFNNLRLGCFVFAKNVCQITDNIDLLRKKSAYNEYLRNNPEITHKLNDILQNLKPTESDFLKNFYSKPQKTVHEATNFAEKGVEFLDAAEKGINSNRFSAEIYKRLGQASSLGLIYATLYSIGHISKFHNNKITAMAEFWEPLLGEKYSKEFASAPTTAIPWTITAFIGSILVAISAAKSFKNDFDSSYQRNKSLLLLKELIKSCKKIVRIIEKNPEIEQFIPEYSIIKKFSDYKANAPLLSSKMVHLIGLLDYYPFNSTPKYYISWQGKIHETFLLYEEIHEEFMPLWQAFAEIDAQLCTQKILNSKNNSFCIPQWINQEKPLLDIQGYWHPMLNSETIVINDITLGASNIAGNSIITGANAGGKTTAMTAIMLCAIFSQSIGIAPAKMYRATPFARMHTYLDITTNLTDNESLFMAQANRAKHLSESIKNCKSNEKALTILDEIFTGTRADFAEKASYQFAQLLGQMPHSICIIATHFPMLTELEKTNLFINYQAAPATIHEDGSLTYPYLIIPGISTQNIADHILKHKGILTN